MNFSSETLGAVETVTMEASRWFDIFLGPLEKLSAQILGFLPNLLSAVVILIVGGVVVRVLMGVVSSVLKKLNIDKVFDRLGITSELSHLGVDASFSEVLVAVIRLFLRLVVWIAAIDVLKIHQLTQFVEKVAVYLPNVIVGVLILGIGVAVAKFVQGVCEKVMGKSGKVGGRIAKISIVVFTAMVVLSQLGIGTALIETLFAGVVGSLAIAGGIAFGLGGKERAAEIIKKMS